MEEELERILEERKVTGGRFPDFFPFTEIGDKLIGQFIRTREYEDRPIYEIRDLKEKEWSVGAPVVLRRIMDEINLKSGDYVLISYEGEGKSKKGRMVKQFSVGKISEEEAKKLLGEKFKPPAEIKPFPPIKKPVEEKPREEKPKEEKPKSEFDIIVEKILGQTDISKDELMERIQKKRKELMDFVTLEGAAMLVGKELSVSTKIKLIEKPIEKELSSEKRAEIEEFFGKLFDFYDEMKKDDIEKKITIRFPEVTFTDVLDICKDLIVYDSKTDILRKK